MPAPPALSPWVEALAAEEARLDEPWGEVPAEYKARGYVMTRRTYMNAFSRIAKEKSEWAGIPVQLPGEAMTIEKSYFGADGQNSLNVALTAPKEPTTRACSLGEYADQTVLRNHFWSSRLRADVMVWQEGPKFGAAVSMTNRLDYGIRTIGCADAWQLETEFRAMECLRGLVSHQQFRTYFLTGQFIERSKRSGLFYVFRRLRPTLALSGSTGTMRILAALCLHPIAYYQNSFAGAMCPTDDVVGHLMLMRGDEPMLWRRANQHNPQRPEAGI